MPCAARPRWPGVDVFERDWWREGRTKKLRTVWLSPEVSSDEAVAEVKALLGGSVLASPKPTRLVRRILSLDPAGRRTVARCHGIPDGVPWTRGVERYPSSVRGQSSLYFFTVAVMTVP